MKLPKDIKPCKGCRYFTKGRIWHYCEYHAHIVRFKDPLTGEMGVRVDDRFEAKDMRSPEGQCGPDRKLYDTNINAFKRWFNRTFRKEKEK